MPQGNKYKVLIVEDDPLYADPLKEGFDNSDDFKVIAQTDSSEEGFKYVKNGLPDVVIVDLELVEGDGIRLLTKIRECENELAIKPYLLVTTAYTSPLTLAKIKNGLADYVFKKQNAIYNPQEVINHLRTMSSHFYRNTTNIILPIDSEMDREHFQRVRIESELTNYYISPASNAKEYLVETLFIVINLSDRERKNLKLKKIFAKLSKQFQKKEQTINMGIDRLIKDAFIKTDEEHLRKAYTPYLDIDTSAPSNKEFIVYTAEKIKRENNL